MVSLERKLRKDTRQIQPYDWEELVEKAIEAIDEFFRQHWDKQ